MPVPVEEGEELLARVVLRLHGEAQVRPVEAVQEDARLPFEELAGDVAAGRDVGGRRQRDGLDVAEAAADVAEERVFGSEIVAPLRDAMRLVDGEQANAGAREPLDRRSHGEPLGRGIEQAHAAVAHGVATRRFSAESFAELRLPASMPRWRSAATWSRIKAISGETTRVRPLRARVGSW